jgi:spore germination protein GerM
MNRILSVVVPVLLLAACGSSTGDLGGVNTPPSSEQPSIDAPTSEPIPGATEHPGQTPAATPDGSASGTTTVRAYFFLGSFVDNAGLAPVLREVPKTKAVGAAAMDALLAGPNDDELGARPAMYTTLPAGTAFLGLTIDNGVATVNLSKEFESGGGSASVLGRLAQVVYTLTQFPTITSVRFELDGEPVDVFSGEGVALAEPVGRADYTDQLPAIFLDRPAWGGVPGNPGRIAGTADVFEATFRFRIQDGQGRALASGPVSASCGSGCRGTFDATIPYSVNKTGWGMLQVWEPSAKDGSVTNLTEYPVWLTP